ncbi:MAG: hypothetical protein Q4C91_14225 [Eubacteriales bacterium]|nr:hypothetical protein [Eubacteriales bacterium]
MEDLLRLNDYNVRKNAFAGAHDPSMMWDPVTKSTGFLETGIAFWGKVMYN